MEGARKPPFTLSTIIYKVVVYAPAERADTLPRFLLYPYMYSVVSKVSSLSELTILKSFRVRRVLGKLHLTNQKLDHSVHKYSNFKSYMETRHKRYYKQEVDMAGKRIGDHGKIRVKRAALAVLAVEMAPTPPPPILHVSENTRTFGG